MRLPIRTVNALNRREHWAKRSTRTRAERHHAWAEVFNTDCAAPCAVSLTREAPRAMDGDGLQASFKAIRDGVADALGVNDNDPRVSWQYAQRKSKEYAVVIEIRSAT